MAKYRIMTFDGGGVRGALTATLLKRLNTLFPGLLKNVDLFAGTSTGSFIALGLAYGKTPEELVELYSKQKARFIFRPQHINLARPRYDNKHLMAVLNSVFPPRLRLRDLNRNVLVPSFEVIGPNSGNWGPTFYNNFPNSPTLDEYVVEVALASSAAPTYFPSYRNHIDGGVIANNPSTAAIAIAKDEKAGHQDLDDIFLLSIGTGFSPSKITANTGDWGVLQWALNPSPPPELPLLSILGEGVVEADTYFSSQLLGGRYFRLNPTLPEPISLDAYKQIPNLVSLAESFNLGQVTDWLTKNWF